MGRFFKAFFTTFLVIILLFVGSIGFFVVKNHIENPQDFFSEVSNGDKNVSFLMLGVDNLDTSTENSSRSDTIMVVNMNLDTGKVDLISVPRDTYASIEGYKKQKINHSYNYGGPELTLNSVNNLLGTNIEYYVTVSYKFVGDIVDIIGGVDVDVPQDMVYKDEWADPPLDIQLAKGPQTLNGNSAMQFLRYRGYANADLGRVQAQQQFVSSFLDKLKSPASILKAPMLLRSYDKNTLTNLPFSQVVKIGLNLRKLSKENISTQTLPGSPSYRNGVSYFFLDEGSANSMLKEIGLK
ncbi:LCP family protein [Anaerosphaera multitolerans]|uniref:LytR family transcriptional regulator n=1 Tax=Anaerosphaera multitolerans TaxID=2487351 RepID=A0A437S7J2_9FIRM|nr:LCP family protein [Anaerosphaera multitolerans]RVU54914.1 LytR family transcriptional regulator [Anaerosphaera multitolerans]